MPLWLACAALFGAGAITGSALLCYTWRVVRAKKKFLFEKFSVCDWCGQILPRLALIPIIGIVLAKGVCRKCQRAVPLYSVLAEISIGTVWAGIFWFNPQLSFISLGGLLLISAILITIIISDFFWQEIPVKLIWGALIVLILISYVEPVWLPVFMSSITGALVAAGFFLWQYVLSRGKWVGGADTWIGALSGALVGWSQIVLVTAVGYVGAAVYALAASSINRQKQLDRVPLGAFLAWSTLIFLLAKLP